VRYPPDVQATVLGMLAPNSGFLTRRHFEAVETQTEIPAETVRGWAAQARMLVLNKTGRRGRPPGSCGTPYQRRGADAVPRIVGRADPPESSYRLTADEQERLDWFIARREPLTWNEGFTIRLRFGD